MVSVWKTLRFSTWLGWQAESNWMDPFLFAIYSVVRPVATVLIVVFMYLFVLGMGAATPQTSTYFSLMFIGTAFYMYVAELLFGLSWIVLEDREHYKMLKYWYITPSDVYVYLLGRGLSKVIITTIAVAITLLVGVLVLGVRLNPSGIDIPTLVLASALGFMGMLGIGIMLAGVTLLVARHQSFLGESLAGVFYLLCGVIFPISVLPSWLQPASMAIPLTYWLELTKRSMLGVGDPLFTGWGGPALIVVLLVTSLLLFVSSLLVYRSCDTVARRKGYLDRTTWY